MDVRKDHLVGSQVGDYLVEERIGVGGMGVVYRAVQKRIGKQVAIKILRAEVMDDPREMERFLDEARAVNAISHRGIVNIFGAGELADGRQYLVMEYLKGESLDEKLQREGRISAAEVIPILEEIANALGGVHGAGIVHRDLKPGNVFLVEQSDGKPWVKLLDFGLARRGERTDVSRIAGTPDYLSPEHSRGLPAGPPSDLYAFGVMTFHLLTGQLPFAGRSALEVMEKHVYAEPPNALALEPSIPPALETLLTSLMRKEPGARPQLAQVKALLKTAAKEARSASTQPGTEALAPELAAARAAAAALEPTVPDAAPLLEPLPLVLQGKPAARRPRAPDSPSDRRHKHTLWLAVAVAGLAGAAAIAFSWLGPTVEAIDPNQQSANAVVVKPEVVHVQTLQPETPDPSPPDGPVDPDGELMPANPALAATPDGGS